MEDQMRPATATPLITPPRSPLAMRTQSEARPHTAASRGAACRDSSGGAVLGGGASGQVCERRRGGEHQARGGQSGSACVGSHRLRSMPALGGPAPSRARCIVRGRSRQRGEGRPPGRGGTMPCVRQRCEGGQTRANLVPTPAVRGRRRGHAGELQQCASIREMKN